MPPALWNLLHFALQNYSPSPRDSLEWRNKIIGFGMRRSPNSDSTIYQLIFYLERYFIWKEYLILLNFTFLIFKNGHNNIYENNIINVKFIAWLASNHALKIRLFLSLPVSIFHQILSLEAMVIYNSCLNSPLCIKLSYMQDLIIFAQLKYELKLSFDFIL